MFNRIGKLTAIVASAAALLLSGCGRPMPGVATYRAPGAAQAAGHSYWSGSLGQHKSGPSLGALMQQATQILHQQYPNAAIYELSGNFSHGQQVDAGDFDRWSFGALDDANQPQSTVYIAFENGKFGPVHRKNGFDFGHELTDVTPQIDLGQAIRLLRQANYAQDFQYVELYRVINPTYTQAYYIFSSDTAIVTVGAADGSVSRPHAKNWSPVGAALPAMPLPGTGTAELE